MHVYSFANINKHARSKFIVSYTFRFPKLPVYALFILNNASVCLCFPKHRINYLLYPHDHLIKAHSTILSKFLFHKTSLDLLHFLDRWHDFASSNKSLYGIRVTPKINLDILRKISSHTAFNLKKLENK